MSGRKYTTERVHHVVSTFEVLGQVKPVYLAIADELVVGMSTIFSLFAASSRA